MVGLAVFSFALASACHGERAQGGETAATNKESDARAADRKGVAAAMSAFVQAFKARDAKALAAQWTAEGEYENEAGVTVRGRAELEKVFAEFFANTPELEAEAQSGPVRFLSRDSAIEEGTVRVRRGAALTTTTARYTAFFAREDGQWRLARLDESASEDKARVADLEWLIGEWKSVDHSGAEIQVKYSWAPNHKFIHAAFTIKEKELALNGNQVIGVDPETGALRTWTFEANGGIAEAHWERDGDHWVLDVVGTLPDGRTLTESNVLRRINNNTFTFQSIHRLLGEEELPDLAPVKVTRIAATK